MLRAIKLNSNLYFRNNSGINMKQVIHPLFFITGHVSYFPKYLSLYVKIYLISM